MTFTIEVTVLHDRWIAEVLEVPGALAYGKTYREAISQVLDTLENRKVTEVRSGSGQEKTNAIKMKIRSLLSRLRRTTYGEKHPMDL